MHIISMQLRPLVVFLNTKTVIELKDKSFPPVHGKVLSKIKILFLDKHRVPTYQPALFTTQSRCLASVAE